MHTTSNNYSVQVATARRRSKKYRKNFLAFIHKVVHHSCHVEGVFELRISVLETDPPVGLEAEL